MLPVPTPLIANVMGSAVIAVFSAMLFLLLCRAGLRAQKLWRHRSIFASAIMHSPGHRLRHKLDDQRDQLRVIVATLLVLPLFFAAILLAWPGELDVATQDYRWWGMCALSSVILGILSVNLIKLLIGQRRTRYNLTADIAVSHALERVKKRDFSVFHDVNLGGVVADKVIVGAHGVFALRVHVQPQRRRADGDAPMARADGRWVDFPDGTRLPLIGEAKKLADAVAAQLSSALGKPIVVCPTLVLPGWNLTCAEQPSLPVVNERNIDMVPEWSTPAGHLLNEDAQAVYDHLAQQCRDLSYKD